MIAIIPARGGSKRIPKKNIIEFHGKPMIAWTIEAALKSKYITRVIVSTDDQEIAEVSIKYGAEVPFLREQNADDHSPISLATIHCLDQLNKNQNLVEETVVQLMANCPIRNSSDIDESIENFLSKGNSFQISSFSYGWMNPWWAHIVDNQGKCKPLFDPNETQKRSQDLPELECPTGAIWIANIKELKKFGSFYGENYSFYRLNWKSALDIDNYEDLEMAQAVFSIKSK